MVHLLQKTTPFLKKDVTKRGKVMSRVFEKVSTIDAPIEEVFGWHKRDGAFHRLTPLWESTELVEQTAGIDTIGAKVTLRMKVGPLSQTWLAEHTDYQENKRFQDIQRRGPFSQWVHTHHFEARGDSTILRDEITYQLPLGPLGEAVGDRFVRNKLQRMFDYRHIMTKQDIAAHQRTPLEPMKIAITGASGLLGSALVPFLTTGGHEVLTIGRSPRSSYNAEHIQWNPSKGELDGRLLEGVNAVIHLAGAGIADERWTEARKQLILQSRVDSTRLLCETLAALNQPPQCLISASGIGYYGSSNDGLKTEDSPAGNDFPADVCKAWEAATLAAEKAGIRTIHLRIGVVMTPEGGALGKMMLPFQLGAGGPVGHGKQWMSWIGIHDLTDVLLHCIATESLQGPLNAVTPQPVSQRDFARTLGKVLKRPAFLPLPGFAVKVMFGKMGETLLLGGTEVSSSKLEESGFVFRTPTLESTLRLLLGK